MRNNFDVYQIPPYIVIPEVINFFGNKKILIHYYFDWHKENGIVSFKNLLIDRVYTSDRNDLFKHHIKQCWIKNEIPENIMDILMTLVGDEILISENKPSIDEIQN